MQLSSKNVIDISNKKHENFMKTSSVQATIIQWLSFQDSGPSRYWPIVACQFSRRFLVFLCGDPSQHPSPGSCDLKVAFSFIKQSSFYVSERGNLGEENRLDMEGWGGGKRKKGRAKRGESILSWPNMLPKISLKRPSVLCLLSLKDKLHNQCFWPSLYAFGRHGCELPLGSLEAIFRM